MLIRQSASSRKVTQRHTEVASSCGCAGVLTVEHLGAKAACSHVACSVDSDADLRPLRHLPRGLCGGSSGLPPGVVCQGDPETSGGEEHPGTEGGEEAAGASGYGQHPGAQPERETGVHT